MGSRYNLFFADESASAVGLLDRAGIFDQLHLPRILVDIVSTSAAIVVIAIASYSPSQFSLGVCQKVKTGVNLLKFIVKSLHPILILDTYTSLTATEDARY